jgi:hypothetical protein
MLAQPCFLQAAATAAEVAGKSSVSCRERPLCLRAGGQWEIRFNASSSAVGGGLTLTLSADSSPGVVVARDVLIGDVYMHHPA